MHEYQRRKTQRREQLLNAAEALYGERQLNRINIAQIAAAAKVSPVTIYNYFGSKDGLFEAVIHRKFTSYFSEAELLLSTDMPYWNKVVQLVDMLCRMPMMHYADSLLFTPRAEHDDPIVRRVFEQINRSRITPFLRRFYEQGVESGYIAASVPFESVHTYIMAIAPLAQATRICSATDPAFASGLSELLRYGLFSVAKEGHVPAAPPISAGM